MAFFKEQLEHLVETLKAQKMAHSIILAGDQSEAQVHLLIQHIFCKQDHSACGSCSSCLKYRSGNMADYLEVLPDGASVKNHQIEEAQSFMLIRPFESDYKVLLIRQAELTTEQAQNRLLKILEEPPHYAFFIFDTVDPERLLETIRSRSQVYYVTEESSLQIEAETKQKAKTFVHSLYDKDYGTLLDIGVYAKKDKENFPTFLQEVVVLLRDVLIFKETDDIDLVREDHKVFFHERDNFGKIVHRMDSKSLIRWISEIEAMNGKLKNNMNYELTIDNWLFRCLN